MKWVPISEAVALHLQRGWTVGMATPTILTFKGKPVNHVLHGILSFVIPFYFIIWIILACQKQQELTYAVKDEYVWMQD